jgi:hypothetical protein
MSNNQEKQDRTGHAPRPIDERWPNYGITRPTRMLGRIHFSETLTTWALVQRHWPAFFVQVSVNLKERLKALPSFVLPFSRVKPVAIAKSARTTRTFMFSIAADS